MKIQLKLMNINISNKDIFWGYVAQILTMGVGVIVLPFLLRILPSDILGVWYVFQSFMFIANVLDFGFQPVFTRNISYLYSGADQIIKNGVVMKEKGEPNFRLIKVLIRDMKRFYLCITIAFFLILIFIGFFYIRHIIDKSGLSQDILHYWFLFTFTLCFNLYYSYYTCLLQGRGLIKQANIALVISKIVLAIVTIGSLFCGFGLLSIVVGHFLSCLVNRILFAWYNNEGNFNSRLKTIIVDRKESLFKVIYSNAYKQGIDGIGFFLKTQGLLLIVSYYLPLSDTASYGIVVQILGLLATMAILYFRIYAPYFAQLRVMGRINMIRVLYMKCQFLFFVIFIAGGVGLLLLGNPLLELLGSSTYLFPVPLLGFMIVTEMLEYNHTLASYLIAVNNEIPFYKSSIISSLVVVMLGYILVRFYGAGIWGVVFAHFIVNLVYNNWKWPLEISKILSINYFSLLRWGYSYYYRTVCSFCKRKGLIRTSNI